MTTTGGRDDVVARLAEEVGRLGGRLAEIGSELSTLPGTGAVRTAPSPVGSSPVSPPPVGPALVDPAPAPVPGPPAPAAAPPVVGGWSAAPPPPEPVRWWNPLGAPGPASAPAAAAPVDPPAGPAWAPAAPAGPVWTPGQPLWTSPPPTGPREHWWQREGAASRAIALAGSAVTLIGVVMLLVLAAQGGWFGPVPRVVGGAVLALALVGLAFRVHRREHGHAGAVALAGTGAAGLYLDVVAATAFYGWLPDPVGVGLAAAVVAAGLALAHRWDSQALAVVVVAGAAVLSPALVEPGSLGLVAFLLALQVGSALPVQLVSTGRRWPVLVVLRTLAPVLAAVGAVADAPRDDTGRLLVVLTCLVVTAVGLGLALLDLRRRPSDPLATGALALAVGPSLLAAGLLERWATVSVAGGLAVVLVVLVVTGRGLGTRARGTLVALAALSLYQATAVAGSADSAAALLLVEALAFTALAHRIRSRAVLLTAFVYAALGTLTLAVQVPVDALVSARGAVGAASPAGVLAAVLLVAAALALAAEVQWSHVLPQPRPVWWIAALAALYGTTTALVTGSVLVSARDGFVVGHGAATVVWVVAGLVLLARGLAHRGRGALEARAAGLLLVAAAVGKLLLFDLAALNGIVRVAAFLVTGLLLLWRGALARGAEPAEPAAEDEQHVV